MAGRDLAVDGRRLLGVRAGVARYLISLLREWDRGVPPFERVRLYTPAPVPDDWIRASPTVRNEVLPGVPLAFGWENTRLRSAARRDAVLFCPSQRMPVAHPGRVVVTMFGAIPTRASLSPASGRYWFAWFHEHLYRYAARHADLVLTDSERSLRDIVAAYGITTDRVRVVPLAPAAQFRRVNQPEGIAAARRRHVGGDHPYAMFVGTFSPRRNIPLLIQAFGDAVRRTGSDHRLLLVGRNVPAHDIAALASEAGVADRVVHAGGVGDDDLLLLYNGADVVVHPAANEPSVLPVLEAMAVGVAVVAVRSSALADSIGEGALLVDGPTREALADALERLLADPALRANLVRHAERVVGPYTWARTARETLAHLAAVAGM